MSGQARSDLSDFLGGRDASDTMSHAVATWCAGLEVRDLPGDVVDKARTCLVDSLAASLAGSLLPYGPQTRAYAATAQRDDGAVVVNSDLVAAPAEAAFANASMAAGSQQNDTHTGSVSHMGGVVPPVVLALAQTEKAGGADLLAAIVAGYETMARLGRVVVNPETSRAFRPTGLVGPFGGAAAAARLMRLDPDRTRNALGFGANAAAGLMAWAHTGGTEVFFHSGYAAANGIASAFIAAAGAQVSPAALEGEGGMFQAYGGRDKADLLVETLGAEWEILEVYFKPVPGCNFIQSACQAADRLVRENDFDLKEVTAVTVRTFEAARAYPGCDNAGPITGLQGARLSIQCGVACALASGGVRADMYLRYADPEVARLTAATGLVVVPEYDVQFPHRQPSTVEVTLAGGRRLSGEVADLTPLDGPGVRARFLDLAGRTIGAERGERILTAVDALPDGLDAGAIGRMAGLPG